MSSPLRQCVTCAYDGKDVGDVVTVMERTRVTQHDIPRSPFGTWLRKRRLQAGLTQEELGHLIGRGQDYVARWEGRNRKLPPHEDLVAILNALGASFEEMMQALGADTSRDRPDVPVFTRLRSEVNMADELSDPLKAIILEAVEYAERRAEREKDLDSTW